MENVRAFAKSVHAMRYAGYRKVRGKLYPGMRHEILNEKEHQKVFEDLALYIKKNLRMTAKRV
jgi:alpha-beta hydrolase superfamily lysophospholipase